MSLISELGEVKLAFPEFENMILIPAFQCPVSHPANLSSSLKTWELNIVKGISIVSQHGRLTIK